MIWPGSINMKQENYQYLSVYKSRGWVISHREKYKEEKIVALSENGTEKLQYGALK